MGGVNFLIKNDFIKYSIENLNNNDFVVEILNFEKKNSNFNFVNLNELIKYFNVKFENKNDLYFFSNGFQSWSITKEYNINESYEKLALLKVFNKFVLRDNTYIKNRRRYFYSNYFTYFRIKNNYIVLYFLPYKTPPIIFYFDKKNFNIKLDFLYNKLEDLENNFLGKLLIFKVNNFFELKDKLTYYKDKFNLKGRFESNRSELLDNIDNKSLNKKYIFGWESWYNHYSHIDKNIIINNLEGLEKTENIFKKLIQKKFIQKEKLIFQIDDGWEITVGEWEYREDRFPEGMKFIADKIKEKGYIPGIWIAPFVLTRFSKIYKEKFEWILKDDSGIPVVAGFIPTPEWGNDFYLLDLSIKEVQDYLKQVFNKIINEWGYKFLKLDFLYAGLLEGKFREGKSAFYWYENALKIITSFDAIFLGCGVPLQTSSNYFHINRIGADVKEKWDDRLPKLIRHQGRPSAYISLNNVINRAIFDKVFFLNDPDVFFTRTNNIELKLKEKELISITNFLFGTQMMVSDDLFDENLIDKTLIDKLVEYFNILKDYDFGNIRLEKDVYFIFTKNLEYFGIINLRGKNYIIKFDKILDKISDLFISDEKDFSFKGKIEDKLKTGLDKPLIQNFNICKNVIIFEPHSISIF